MLVDGISIIVYPPSRIKRRLPFSGRVFPHDEVYLDREPPGFTVWVVTLTYDRNDGHRIQCTYGPYDYLSGPMMYDICTLVTPYPALAGGCWFNFAVRPMLRHVYKLS